jgi:hypothetical protein
MKVSSVSEKLEISKNVDAQPRVTCTKVTEQISVLLSMLNNIMVNKKNLLQQCITVQKGRKKVNTHMKGTTRYPKMI